MGVLFEGLGPAPSVARCEHSTLSEYGHAAYQIRGMTHAAHGIPGGQKVKIHLFTDHGHVTYN